MPRETPKPSKQLTRRRGRFVCIGNRIAWQRKDHTFGSWFLSLIACLLCIEHGATINHFFLCSTFGSEMGTQLTLILFPFWVVYIWLKVPNIFLLEPV